MRLARLSVDNPVLVNLVMILIAVSGILIYMTITREMFPEFSLEAIGINTRYPGASPEEVEKLITVKIENEIADVDGIDSLYSESREGLSMVTAELKKEAELDQVLDDIKARIDTIEDLPEDAEEPEVRELKNTFPVLTVSLYGDIQEGSLKEIAEDLKEEISKIEGVGSVHISGARERQIWVEVNPDRLEQYSLTLNDVKRALEGHNLNLPGGVLKTERGEFLIRTVGEILEPSGLEKVVLLSDPSGNMLRLGQVATISNSFEDPVTIGHFSGKRAINLAISKEKKGDVIKIAREVRGFVDEYKKKLPPEVSLGVFNDFSVYVKNRLNTLKQNGVAGLLLVLISLCLFLNIRIAVMTALGIPISFMGALILMQGYGLSLNMISMFSLILVLGIVVDDAIVVTENVYRHIEEGMEPKEAAVVGTAQVQVPVIATVLTTIAAFLPMLLIGGKMGKFMSVIPKVVTFALVASLMEALIILPSHLAEWINPKKIIREKKKASGTRLYDRFLEKYTRLLKPVLRWRYVSLTAAFAITAVTVSYAATRIPFTLFHEFESTQFFINVETPATSKIEDTEKLISSIEQMIMKSLPVEELRSLASNTGIVFLDFNRMERGSNVGQVIVELTEAGKRERSSKQIIYHLRSPVRAVAGAAKIQFVEPQAGPGGPDIEIRVVGERFDVLKDIADRIKEFLAGFPAAKDIRDDFGEGKKELRILLKEEASSLGLDVRSVALQVRNSFHGTESTKIQRSDEDIPIVVKFPEGQRQSPSDLENMKITTASGLKVNLSDVAILKEDRGYSKIIRTDRKRSITVLAEVDQKEGNALQITNKVKARFSELGRLYPGYRLEFKGERKEFEQSLVDLEKSFLVAVLIIYVILGALFKSYLQPLVVMISIPFAATGVVLGHAVMGLTLGILSLMGMIALAGVVVNDSLILIDFINKLRLKGLSLGDAVVTASRMRARPILITTVTTILGLIPLGFFSSGQAKFLSPMAISIIFGLATATFLTLLIIPCAYLVIEDIKIKGSSGFLD